jgi:hypothetical protein
MRAATRKVVFGIASLAAASGLIAGYSIQRARAAGVPGTKPLMYSGVLTDASGNPLSGSKNIQIGLYDMATAGTTLCTVGPSSVALTNGGFQLALPDACTAPIHASPDVWLEVFVDGTSLGRNKLSAVPYALEADHAVSATTATAAGGALGTTITTLQSSATALDTRLTAVETAQPGKSAFQAHQTVAQNFQSGAGANVIFDTKDFDPGTEFTTSSGKFTSKTGGVYDVTCTLEWNVASAGTSVYYQAEIWVNQNAPSGVSQTLTSNGSYPTVTAHGLVRLAQGDSILCQGYQASGTTQSLANDPVSANRFSAIRISP